MLRGSRYLQSSLPIWLGAAGFVFQMMGCAQKQPDLSFEEMTNPDCYFVKTKMTANPAEMVRSYLERDAAGELTIVSGWFDSAVLCPGHEAGPALSYVIKSSRILAVDVQSGSASARVKYDVIGLVSPGAKQSWHFKKRKEAKIRKFKLVHTAYGWRFNDTHLAEGEFLSVAQAKTRVTGENDKKILSRLLSR